MENSQKTKSLTGQVQLLLKTDKDFPEKLKQHLVLESKNVKNPFQFIVGLFTEGVLADSSSYPEATFGLKGIMVQLAMMIACSKGADAIGGLMKALEGSGNSELISALLTWIKEDFALETVDGDLTEPKGGVSNVQTKNYPVAVKSLTDHRIIEERKAVRPTFLKQAAPSSDLQKVATLSFPPESSAKGPFAVELDGEKMMASFDDGTIKLGNWITNEEKTIKFGGQVKDITSFQYDEEIFILGTAAGTVHLFDAKTLQEQFSVRLGQPVQYLRYAASKSKGAAQRVH